jgi:hypothetical protein
MRSAIDLKHVGLIVSAGVATALRFLSDFSFGTIQEQASLAKLDLEHLAFGSYSALVLSTVGHELRRDWFNLSPQAPLQVTGLLVVLLGAYAILRRVLGAGGAAATVLLAAPFAPLVVIVSTCAWFVLRAAHTA